MELMTVIKIAVVCGAMVGDEKPAEQPSSFCLVNYEVAESASSLYQCSRKHKDQMDAMFVKDIGADVKRAYCMSPGKAKQHLLNEQADLVLEGYQNVKIMQGEL